MTRTKNKFPTKALILSLALLPLVVGCTNRQGESESPVYLTTNLISGGPQPDFINIATTNVVQVVSMTVSSHGKSDNVTDPHGFQTVELGSYRVTYSRLDGGTKVPPPATFLAVGTIPLNGSTTLLNFPATLPSTLQQSPFDQLLPFNGGIDLETGKTEIHMAFTFVFFGETAAGTRVASDPASFDFFFFFQ